MVAEDQVAKMNGHLLRNAIAICRVKWWHMCEHENRRCTASGTQQLPDGEHKHDVHLWKSAWRTLFSGRAIVNIAGEQKQVSTIHSMPSTPLPLLHVLGWVHRDIRGMDCRNCQKYKSMRNNRT
jgi:hypothetical protein